MRTPDGYIINKCLNGDSAAFGFLVDKYRSAVYALAYSKLHDFRDAEDVTQEAFIKAYRDLRRLRRWDSFHAWLYAITANLCKNWIRAQSRRLDSEFIEDQSLESLEEPSIDPRGESPVLELLHEALGSLPDAYQQVLTLQYLGGMNSKEIAEFLGMPATAVRKRLSRARAQLKKGILAMMSRTFEEQRLPANFTFRIIEITKRIKIHPAPRTTSLPWGLSLATGVFLTVLSLSPYVNFLVPVESLESSSLTSELRVTEIGEIPVNILKISQIPAIPNEQGNSNGAGLKLPESQLLAPMAPHGEGDTWAEKADMPTARYGLCCGIVNGKLYAIGGAEDLDISVTVEEYDPQTDKWVKKADMPTKRVFCSAGVVDGKIYVMGGYETKDKAVATVEEYDPVTDTWTRKADMLSPNARFSASTANGKIYAIGGYAGGALARVEEYNPKTDIWTRKTDMPTARGSVSTSVVNGRIYAIGGSLPNPIISTVEEYDPVTDLWTRKSDMPTPRVQHSTVAVDGYIYAIGGASNFSGKTLSVVERYDPLADVWTKRADMPAPKAQFSMGEMDGYIYVLGGSPKFMAANAPSVPPLSDVAVYDTGFAPESQGNAADIDGRGKHLAPWGQIKSDYRGGK
ncbi:sigma-70 family RNA polymerase sigma factor [Candidatus Poribacteria bacterium]